MSDSLPPFTAPIMNAAASASGSAAVPKPARRTRRKILVAVALVALLGGGAAFANAQSKGEEFAAELVKTVESGRLEMSVTDFGRVEPKERIELKSRVSGQVTQVLVEEGDSVKAGQVLLQLDAHDYQRTVAASQTRLEKAQNELKRAEIETARTERGVSAGVVPQIELDQARINLRGARIAVEQARVELATSSDSVNYATIRAPMDGTVIARNIQPGEMVTPGVQASFDGKSQLTVADLSHLLVRVELNQIDVTKVQLGQEASAKVDAYPGESFKAKVTRVAPAAVKSTRGQDLLLFPVEVELLEGHGRIKPGMTAEVRLQLGAVEGALLLPIEAVRQKEGKREVTVLTGEGKAQKQEVREIEVGQQNERMVQVTKGLSAGERVLVVTDAPEDRK